MVEVSSELPSGVRVHSPYLREALCFFSELLASSLALFSALCLALCKSAKRKHIIVTLLPLPISITNILHCKYVCWCQ